MDKDKKMNVGQFMLMVGGIAILALILLIILGAIFWNALFLRLILADIAIIALVYFLHEPQEEKPKETFQDKLKRKAGE